VVWPRLVELAAAVGARKFNLMMMASLLVEDLV
jgi:hypothetical protein